MAQQQQSTAVIVSPAPFEVEAIKSLNPDFQELVRAKFESRVNTYSDNQLIDYLKVIIHELMIHTQSNHMGNDFMTATLAHGAMGELKHFGHRFTLSDARIALREGYRGSFGEIIGLSAVNFAKCFRAYDKWEKRLEANKAFNQAIDAPKITDKPISDMFKIDAEACKNLYNEYKNSSESQRELIMFSSFLHYDYLLERGRINYSVDERRGFYERAKKKYWDLQKKNGVKAEVLKSLKQSPDNHNLSITNEAKRLAVMDYFDKLIKQGWKLKK